MYVFLSFTFFLPSHRLFLEAWLERIVEDSKRFFILKKKDLGEEERSSTRKRVFMWQKLQEGLVGEG